MPCSVATGRQNIPQVPHSANGSRHSHRNTTSGNRYEGTKMGKDSRNIKGSIGTKENQSHWYGSDEMGDNARNLNGSFVSGADLKASGFWDK